MNKPKPNNKDYHFKKLSDFEQLLFREKQVKILLRTLAKKNFEVGVLTTEVQRLEHETNTATNVINLKNNIKGEKRKKDEYKNLYLDSLVKIKTLTKTIELCHCQK